MSKYNFNFDDKLAEEPVTYKGVTYCLREASGGAVVKYRNACTRAATLKNGKPYQITNLADTDILLVSLCLFIPDEAKKPEDWKNVSEAVIKSWPNRIQEDLLKWIKENSGGFDDGLTVEAIDKQLQALQVKRDKLVGKDDHIKNSQIATAVGSE